MKRLTLLALIAAAIIVISMIGCSSDSVTESNIIIGDTTSPAYLFVSDSIGNVSFDALGNGLDLSFELLDMQFPSGTSSKLSYNTKSVADTSIVVSNNYSYSNGWHIFDYSATFIDFEDTTTVQGVDSIQTLVDNTPQQFPDSAAINGMNIRAQYAFENNTFGSGVGHQSFDISATTFDSLGIATINGNSHDTLNAQFIESTDTCSLNMHNSLTITNVQFVIDVSDECPSSGSIIANQNIALDCVGGQDATFDSLNINGDWTATITFHGATETVTLTDGTTTWSVTEDCGPEMTASALSSFTLKE